jgi:Fe-S-cluster-containing hydrogenase component 2
MKDEENNDEKNNDVLSRRRFVLGLSAASATVIVFGTTAYQLWKSGIDIWENSLTNYTVPTANGYLIYDPALCTGCETCEVVCTTFNYGKTNISLSNIHIMRDPLLPDYENFHPLICGQCVEPACLTVCPVAALKIDKTDGLNVRIIDGTECIGCRKCSESCTEKNVVSRIKFDEEKEISVKCHLCKGDPKCVKYCSNGALRYVTKLLNTTYEGEQLNRTTFLDTRNIDIPQRQYS